MAIRQWHGIRGAAHSRRPDRHGDSRYRPLVEPDGYPALSTTEAWTDKRRYQHQHEKLCKERTITHGCVCPTVLVLTFRRRK